LRPVQITVVEDHEGLQRAMVQLLEASGHEVTSFGSAEELLASTDRPRGACLILDIRLPGLSGFALRERLAREGSTLPVIYVTAHDDPGARAQAAREGAAFLVKPVSRKALLAAIARAVGAS
jgi:FixJ family two-component response regulator